MDRVKAGSVVHVGSVTEVFRGAGACIITLLARRELTKSSRVHIVGAHYCYSEFPKSLQYIDVDVEGVAALDDAIEIGYIGDRLPFRKAQVYLEVPT